MDNNIFKWFHATQFNKSVSEVKTSAILRESLIDFEKKERCPDVFTKDDKLRPEIKKFILEKYWEILDVLGEKKEKVKSIYIVGSIVGFYWHKYTDIDVPMVLDVSDEKIEEYTKKIVDKYGSVYAEIKNFTHPINLYLLPYKKEQLYQVTVDGIYELYPNDKFIQKKQPKIKIDHSVFDIAMNWCRKIDLDFGELRRDLSDYMFYKEGMDNIDTLRVSKERLENMESIKWKEIIYDLQTIRDSAKALKLWRTDNHKKISEEFKEMPEKIEITYKNMSMFDGIIVKKLLERYGYSEDMERAKFILAQFKKDIFKKKDVLRECEAMFKKKETVKVPKE